MLAVNYSEIRNNLKDYCDMTIDNLETVLITRKNDRNVVMISLEEYNNLVENAYVMSDANYYKDLVQRAKDVEDNKTIQRDLIEKWKYYFTKRPLMNIYIGKKNDKKTLKRLNNIIKDISRNPYEGLGKPEPLRYALQGYCSRRITLEDRIIYKVESDNLIIISCASTMSRGY